MKHVHSGSTTSASPILKPAVWHNTEAVQFVSYPNNLFPKDSSGNMVSGNSSDIEGPFPGRGGCIFLSNNVQAGSSSYRSSWTMCAGKFFLGSKEGKARSDCSLPSDAEIKNLWNFTSIFPHLVYHPLKLQLFPPASFSDFQDAAF